MALSRHSDEWKRTIATAALAGVRFRQVPPGRWVPGGQRKYTVWYAVIEDGALFEGQSMIDVARRALNYLGG